MYLMKGDGMVNLFEAVKIGKIGIAAIVKLKKRSP